MTKKQCEKNLAKMNKDLREYIKKETLRLMNSGAIDLDKFENNFAAPKIILAVALKNASEQYVPLDTNFKKDMKNLMHF